MVKIIEHDDYNAPIDDDNVVNIAIGGNIEGTKAFKVMENVWIIPHPKMKDDSHSYLKNTTYIEDPTYCNTDVEKTAFIKETIKLLKRINTTQSGKKLLELLSFGLPLPHDKNDVLGHYNSISIVKGDIKLGTYRIEKVPTSVMIYPLQGNKDRWYADFSKDTNFDTNILASRFSKIYYAPNIASVSKEANGNMFVVDPVTQFYHELVHALHTTYGVFIGSSSGADKEEKVTFGGVDRTEIDNEIKALDNKLRQKLEGTANHINNSNYTESQKEYFAKKYLLEKKGNKYKVTDIGFNFFRYFMRDAFSEYNFTLELGVKTRSDYYQGFFADVDIDILNEEQYSIEKGFVKGINVSDNGLNISKYAYMNNDNGDKIPVESIVGTCGARNRRDILQQDYIPLEDEFLEEDKKRKIVKRSATCNMETLFEDFDTVENRITELPKKILTNITSEEININMGKTAQTNTDNINSYPLSDSVSLELDTKDLVVDSNNKNNIDDLETHSSKCKSTVALIEYNNKTLKDKENAHRYNKNIDYKASPINITTEDLDGNMKRGNSSYTHAKYFPKTMSSIHGATTALQLFDILSTIKNDFTIDKDSKDGIHKINDLAQATPFVASALEGLRVVKSGSVAPMLGYAAIALNLGLDIYDRNYVGLAEDIGIFILLEAFPELTLPFMLLGYFKQWLDNRERREQIKDSIFKLLAQRDEYIDISAINREKSWSKSLYTKIHVSVDSIEKQLVHNAEAFIHNIKHKIHNISASDKDKKTLHLRLLTIEKQIWKNIEIVRISVLDTLYNELSKVFIDQYKKISLQQMSSLNEDTKQTIKDILAEKDPAINDSFIEECLNQMNDYMKQHDIGKKLDLQIKVLQKMIQEGKKNINDEHIPTSCITVIKDKITDVIGNKVIESKSKINEGRKDKSFTINNEKLRISSDVYKNLNINHNFTISFWIKIPYLAENSPQIISLIRCGINNNQGWEFGVNNRKIYFTIHVDEVNKITLNGVNNIRKNKWTKITISNQRSLYKLMMYMDAYKEAQHNYVRNYQIEEHNVVNKGIIFSTFSDQFNCEISEFKTYYKKFNLDNVVANYHKDFDQDILYDYSGEPLLKDKEYYLVNKSFPNYYYQINQNLKLVLLNQRPQVKPTITIESKEVVIQDKEVVKVKLDNEILGLKIEALQSPKVPYSISDRQFTCGNQPIDQISRLWISNVTKPTTSKLKLFSLKDFFIDDQYDYSALGIVTPDVKDENMSGVLINLNTPEEGVICMATNTYLNTSIATNMNSDVIPLVQPILDRGVLKGNELIEAMTFYFVRKN